MQLNPQLADLPVYHPGRPLEEVARELDLPLNELVKLASNENPLGPSPKAIKAMQETASQIHLYPDGNAFYIRNRLANKLEIDTGNLIFGNGSNEIIEFVAHALLGPDTNIVVSQYCFAIYPIVAHLAGAGCIIVPAKDHGHNLPAMLEAITPDTRIVFVANPNNLDGVKELVSQLKKRGREEQENHRMVHRPWGWYHTVDSGPGFQVKRIRVNPGAALSLQEHRYRAEHWVIVNGIATITKGDRKFLLNENESTYVSIGERHRIANEGPTPLEIIEIQSGEYLGEDDIVRYEDKYHRLDPPY